MRDWKTIQSLGAEFMPKEKEDGTSDLTHIFSEPEMADGIATSAFFRAVILALKHESRILGQLFQSCI